MRSMKLSQLAVLLVIGVGLFTSTQAYADDTITLACAVGSNDPDYGSTGQATLTNVRQVGGANLFPYFYEQYYEGNLTVACVGLTPGTTYSTPVGKFKADRKGNLIVQGTVRFNKQYEYVLDPNWPDSYYLVLLWSDDVPVDVARNARKTSLLVLRGVFVAPAGY